MGPQILGARSPGQLNFVWWCLVSVGPQYGTCFMSPSKHCGWCMYNCMLDKVGLIIRISLPVPAIAEDDTAGPVYMKEPPNRVDFSNTTGAVVECAARGNPVPEIIWVRSDGTAVGDVPGLRQVQGSLIRHVFSWGFQRSEQYDFQS